MFLITQRLRNFLGRVEYITLNIFIVHVCFMCILISTLAHLLDDNIKDDLFSLLVLLLFLNPNLHVHTYKYKVFLQTQHVTFYKVIPY